MIRLIGSDLDGTLLSDHKKISEINLKAINRLKAQGMGFVIVTGRDYASVKQLIADNALACPAVVCNGAEIRDEKGEVIYSLPFDINTATAIFDSFMANNVPIVAFNENYILTSVEKEIFVKKSLDSFVSRGFTDNMNTATKLMADFHGNREIIQINSPQALVDYQALKIETPFLSENNTELIEALRTIENISLVIYPNSSMEITMKAANKGDGLKWLCTHLGYSVDEVHVFGDSNNDLPMFKVFPHNTAMSTADENVREFASDVSDNSTSAGVGLRIIKIIEDMKKD